jgi:hypothetical protein
MTSVIYHAGIQVGGCLFKYIALRSVRSDRVVDGVREIISGPATFLHTLVTQTGDEQVFLADFLARYNSIMAGLGDTAEVLEFGDLMEWLRNQAATLAPPVQDVAAFSGQALHINKGLA